MKSIRSIIKETVYKPKGKDELRFFRQHTDELGVTDYTSDKRDDKIKSIPHAGRDADNYGLDYDLSYDDLDIDDEDLEDLAFELDDEDEDEMYESKSHSLKEEIKPGKLVLDDGKTINVSAKDAEKLNALFRSISGSNRKKMEEIMKSNKDGFEDILDFAGAM